MIDRVLAWLKSIYIKPVPASAAAEIQTSEVKYVSQINLSILTNSQPADGVSANVVQALVTDANGYAVPGALVSFSAPAGTVTPAQGTADPNGQVSASLISSTEGPATLVATLSDGTTASVNTLYFVAVPASVDTATTLPVTPISPLDSAKAKFAAFVAFVEHGIEVLGADAEADLVAFKDKYL